MWDPKLNLRYSMFDETPEATGIIDFDSLIPVCQIVVQKFS